MNPSTPTIDQKGTAMGFLLSSVEGGGEQDLRCLRSRISPVRWFGVPMVGNRNSLADMVMCAGRGMFI